MNLFLTIRFSQEKMRRWQFSNTLKYFNNRQTVARKALKLPNARTSGEKTGCGLIKVSRQTRDSSKYQKPMDLRVLMKASYNFILNRSCE